MFDVGVAELTDVAEAVDLALKVDFHALSADERDDGVAEIARLEAKVIDADWKLAKAEHGDAVTTDRLWRTPAQRRADALVEMARRATTAPANGKRPEPLVIIHVDLDTFEHALARVIGTEPPDPLGTQRLCETDDGTVISPTQMIEQALLGHVRRLVYERPGVILDYGNPSGCFEFGCAEHRRPLAETLQRRATAGHPRPRPGVRPPRLRDPRPPLRRRPPRRLGPRRPNRPPQRQEPM